jgi:hypothetical protein
VTYADPYTSDSEEEDPASSSRGCMMDRLQPKLLFPSAGKATHQSGRGKSRSNLGMFASVKKSQMAVLTSAPTTLPTMPSTLRPSLNVTQGNAAASRDLLERLDRAGWSDDDDEDEEQGKQYHHPKAVAVSQFEDEEEDEDDYDHEMTQAKNDVEDDNPFLEPTTRQTNSGASFLLRLQQTQSNFYQQQQQLRQSTSNSSGVIRSSQSNHRFNPYSQQPIQGKAANSSLSRAMHIVASTRR